MRFNEDQYRKNALLPVRQHGIANAQIGVPDYRRILSQAIMLKRMLSMP
jgi:hypothetical protein